MVALINDRDLERRLIRHRRRTGTDRYDEVWEGVYVMAPIADNQHQFMATDLVSIFHLCIDNPGLGRSVAGVNVSDRETDWKKNYRIPDLAVFLTNTAAIEHRTFWHGGPDFGVEIASPNDRAEEKVPFYESTGTKELLIIDRDPWLLRFFRRQEDRLLLAGTSSPDSPARLRSEIIPLSFELDAVDQKVVIRLVHNESGQVWIIRPRDLPPARPRRRSHE